MKVLFDQGVPAPLRTFLSGHSVETAYEKGWQELKNGELLNEAEQSNYDIFITTDQNLKYQQALANRKISIIVLNTTSWPKIRTQISLVIAAIDRAKSNSFEEVLFNT
ncbi:MAG: hypothetical protein KF713_00015 [Turneriella sp.]|nr:hypothetical protein [Turneriella sp.]